MDMSGKISCDKEATVERFVPSIFLLTVPTQFLLWTLGSIATPHPAVFSFLLVCGLLGGCLSLLIGATRFANLGRPSRVGMVGFGVATSFSIAWFVFSVLHNSSSEVDVVTLRSVEAKAVTELRVLNLNVLHGFPEFHDQETRFQHTVHEFKDIDADIIVLQEAWSTSRYGPMVERLAAQLQMNHTYARANGSRNLLGFEEGSAVLSKLPLRNARRIVLEPRQPFWENRIVLLVDVNLGGEIVTIAGVHLSTSIPEEQVRSLLSELPAKNLLFVAGDFNAEPMTRAINAMEKAGNIRAAPKENRLYYFPHPTMDLLAKPDTFVDHVFLSEKSNKEWEIGRSIRIATSKRIRPCIREPISDHDAIVVELRRR